MPSSESKFALRLPTELYETVRSKAADSGRSINEYIVFVLSDYHRLNEEILARLDDHEQRITTLENNMSVLQDLSRYISPVIGVRRQD